MYDRYSLPLHIKLYICTKHLMMSNFSRSSRFSLPFTLSFLLCPKIANPVRVKAKSQREILASNVHVGGKKIVQTCSSSAHLLK